MDPYRPRREEPKKVVERRGGLMTATEFTEQNTKIKGVQQQRLLSEARKEVVYRDRRTGKRISRDEYILSNSKKVAKHSEKQRQPQAQEELKPAPSVAATASEEDEFDKFLREKQRWGDPMAQLCSKKHKQQQQHQEFNNSKQSSGSKFNNVPQDIPDHSWLKRGLMAAPNCYSIRPGKYWDCVDRSTKKGFR